MKKEQFLRKLYDELKNNGVKNADSICQTYSTRFDLAQEAGLSDDDAIRRFGRIDDIVKNAKKEAELKMDGFTKVSLDEIKDPYKLKISLIATSLEIVSQDVRDFVIDYGTANTDRYRVNQTDHEFILEEKKRSGLKNFFLGQGEENLIRVIIPKSLRINDIEISLMSGNLSVESIGGNNIDINVINGKINVGKVEASELKVNSVNGRSDYDEIYADNASLSSVAGQTEINKVYADRVTISSVTGNTNIQDGEIKDIKFEGLTGSCKFRNISINKKL